MVGVSLLFGETRWFLDEERLFLMVGRSVSSKGVRGGGERPKEEGRATVGLISQEYIWNLMEAEFCRPPSVLCTQADFSRGLAYKSI